MSENNFFEITRGKKDFLPLLLLADPDEKMLYKYLDTGRMFAISVNKEVVSIAVVLEISKDIVEIKNLATKEDFQNKGFATKMINNLTTVFREYKTMWVGTSDDGVAFYEKQGFVFSHIKKDFFKNYFPPVYENGKLLVDMIYLKKDLPKR